MMGPIIRRRLHRDSEDLNNSLEDLCNAPIPLEEALDSFDESPEINHDAINFLVGESLIEFKEDKEEECKPKQKTTAVSSAGLVSPPNPFSVSNTIKSSNEPPPAPDVPKRLVVLANRPAVAVKMKAPEEDAAAVAILARSANFNAMSHSHVKSEEDVAILVEDEIC